MLTFSYGKLFGRHCQKIKIERYVVSEVFPLKLVLPALETLLLVNIILQFIFLSQHHLHLFTSRYTRPTFFVYFDFDQGFPSHTDSVFLRVTSEGLFDTGGSFQHDFSRDGMFIINDEIIPIEQSRGMNALVLDADSGATTFQVN